MMTVKINGSIEDVSMMLVSAERYALGRQTYVVDWTCDFIINNLDLLVPKDKYVMIHDIKSQKNYGDEYDKESWLRLLAILESNCEQL